MTQLLSQLVKCNFSMDSAITGPFRPKSMQRDYRNPINLCNFSEYQLEELLNSSGSDIELYPERSDYEPNDDESSSYKEEEAIDETNLENLNDSHAHSNENIRNIMCCYGVIYSRLS
uniref:Uncharacterized protein LOC114332076 n=1 Tax=Diabrotica virgifera virgifera TaxID=50390 RepID=A0A6P7FYG1_DIAVI